VFAKVGEMARHSVKAITAMQMMSFAGLWQAQFNKSTQMKVEPIPKPPK
jgi:hypothetical protein